MAIALLAKTFYNVMRMVNPNAFSHMKPSDFDVISIPGLADGGIVNTGQMFIAREAGPELVGTIDGRTAVVNNDQMLNLCHRAFTVPCVK